MSDKLKPCPLCGGTSNKDDYMNAVGCYNCEWWVMGDTIEQAVKIWNTRPIEDDLTAKVERLEGDNQFMQDRLNSPELPYNKGWDHCKSINDGIIAIKDKKLEEQKATIDKLKIENAKLRCKMGTCNGGVYPICSGCYIFEGGNDD